MFHLIHPSCHHDIVVALDNLADIAAALSCGFSEETLHGGERALIGFSTIADALQRSLRDLSRLAHEQKIVDGAETMRQIKLGAAVAAMRRPTPNLTEPAPDGGEWDTSAEQVG